MASSVMVSLHFCKNLFWSRSNTLGFILRGFKFFFFYLFDLSTKSKIDNYLIVIVLKYSCWIKLTEARPPLRLPFFHFNGWILWTFFVLSSCFYYPKRNMLAVAVSASGIKVSLHFCNSLFWSRSTLWVLFPEY